MLKNSSRRVPRDAYFELVMQFPLRRIKSPQQHREAMNIFTRLASKDKNAATEVYVETLVTLIAEYERSSNHYFDTSHVTAADLVAHLLEERRMSVNALAKEADVAQSALSEMLNGKRGWSKSAIIKISKYLRINPGIFLK